MSFIWYVEHPDKVINFEIAYIDGVGYALAGTVQLYDTDERGVRGALQATIPIAGNAREVPGIGSDSRDRTTRDTSRLSGSGPRVRRVARMVTARPPTQE